MSDIYKKLRNQVFSTTGCKVNDEAISMILAWQAARAGSESVSIDWMAVEKLADDYMEGYEFRGDEGDYYPTDSERFLIEDCVAGLLFEIRQEVSKRTATTPAKVPESYVLRKQAEAVERATLICRRDGIRPEVSTASCPVYALNDYARRLHQQADEMEK